MHLCSTAGLGPKRCSAPRPPSTGARGRREGGDLSPGLKVGLEAVLDNQIEHRLSETLQKAVH